MVAGVPRVPAGLVGPRIKHADTEDSGVAACLGPGIVGDGASVQGHPPRGSLPRP